MGFVTGFTGGVTITLGVAYLSVLAHERNRTSQALYLRSQSQLLTSIHDPEPQLLPSSRAELARKSRTTFVETAKDRWNEEVENAVRRVQTTDWINVREGMEGAIARLLGRGLEQSRQGIEKVEESGVSKVQNAVNVSKATASKAADRAAGTAKSGADRVAEKTRGVVNSADVKTYELASAAKGMRERTARDVKSEADHVVNSTRIGWNREVERSKELKERAKSELSNPGGTVDAVRGAVRDTFSKGIEKGQELIGKAQAAVGLANGQMDSAVGGEKMDGLSEVDKVLKERYENLHGLDKTVEEALEERYKPIDQKY